MFWYIQYDADHRSILEIVSGKCFSDQKKLFEALDCVVHMLCSSPLGLSSYPQIETLCIKVWMEVPQSRNEVVSIYAVRQG